MFDGIRKLGNPRTDEERRARHKSLYGTDNLPPRGTGQGWKPGEHITETAKRLRRGAK